MFTVIVHKCPYMMHILHVYIRGFKTDATVQLMMKRQRKFKFKAAQRKNWLVSWSVQCTYVVYVLVKAPLRGNY